MKPPIAAECFSAGVDWLTLSATVSNAKRQLELLFADMAMSLHEDGDLPKEAKWLQYRGISLGSHFFYGSSSDGDVVRASSHVADGVLLLLRAYPELHVKATRVDTQLTVLYPPDVVGRTFFRRLADRSNAAAERVKRGRPWHVALRDEFGRGDTVYLGDRKSELFQRAYDKHHENRNKVASGQYPPGSVRFEVEQKASQARQQLQHLLDAQEHQQYVAGYVKSAFEARGVPVLVNEPKEALIRSEPRVTDVQRRLRWLRESVRPAIRELLAEGYEKEVLQELGLDTLHLQSFARSSVGQEVLCV